MEDRRSADRQAIEEELKAACEAAMANAMAKKSFAYFASQVGRVRASMAKLEIEIAR